MRFPTTRWSLLLRAGDKQNPELARAAIETLFKCYWQPLFVFMCRMGANEDKAEDLVQGLLASFLERPFFERVDRDRGRFRNYLCGAARNSYYNSVRATPEDEAESIETNHGDDGSRPLGKTAIRETPEDDFNRAWGQTLLTRVVETVRAEYAKRLDANLFAELLPYVSYEPDNPPYEQLARRIGKRVGATKQAVTRLRRRIRDELRKEVSFFTADEDVDAEIRFLYSALGKK